MSTWYHQSQFNDWFATLRSNRRAREIMPLLHEISSDEEDDEGGDGRGGSARTGGTIQDPPANADSGPGPSSPPEEDRSDQPESGTSSKEKDSPSGTYSRIDVYLLHKMGPGGFFRLPHTMVLKGAGGMIYGSYDKRFRFVSIPRNHIPINPLAYVSNIKSGDFERVGMGDPRYEDINSIIAIAARGDLSRPLLNELRNLEDKVDDTLTPSLFKRAVSKVVTISYVRPHEVEKRGFMKPIQATYNRRGWVGGVALSSERKCKRLFPRTRQIGKMRAISYPRVSRNEAMLSSTFLTEFFIHRDFPRELLKFYKVPSNWY